MSSFEAKFNPSQKMGAGVKWILIICLGVFLLCLNPAFEKFAYEELFFHANFLKPWQMLTYIFIHTEPMHLLMNSIGIIFAGISVEHVFGTRAFVRYFIICGVGAALCAFLMLFFVDGLAPTIGASGALYGILFACYRFFPDSVVYVSFLFPVRLKYLLIVLGVFDFVMLFSSTSGVAHYAHLGGLLSGWLYFRYEEGFVLWLENSKSKRIQVEEDKEQVLKEKVDDILDKINREGIHALSSQEKQYLKKASQKYHD